MIKKTKLISLISIVILLGALFFVLVLNNEMTYVSYKNFLDKVDHGVIKEVTFKEDKIIFKEKDKEEEYYTDNSESATLKEMLLMSDVIVNNEKSLEDILVTTFDVIFILIFLIAIAIALRRISCKSLFKVIKKEKINFSDVVGMDDLKEEMMQIIDILKNKEEYAKKGVRAPRGIILEGEPGNGKTYFARALAGEAKMNFIATKGADFESAVMAIGPAKIRALFKIAKRHAPVIVFIDEFDGIGTKRNYSGSAIETENTRIVTQMLNELDGFKENDGVFVIAATNNSKVLDPALIRPGRFDRKYLVSYPNEKERFDLVKFYTKNMNVDKELDLEKLARDLKGASISKVATIINEAGILAERKNNGIVDLKCINGAMELTREK